MGADQEYVGDDQKHREGDAHSAHHALVLGAVDALVGADSPDVQYLGRVYENRECEDHDDGRRQRHRRRRRCC